MQVPETGLWPFGQSIRGPQCVCVVHNLEWHFLMGNVSRTCGSALAVGCGCGPEPAQCG